MNNNKAGRAYRLREFCGGGNSEPNDTLKNIQRSEITTSQLTGTNKALPVSKGGVKNKSSQYHG